MSDGDGEGPFDDNIVPQSQTWTDHDLRLQYKRFVAELATKLDIEAGLADALRHLPATEEGLDEAPSGA